MTSTTDTAGKIRGKDVARFILLPEILPRAKALGGAGFGYLAFLIASVYRAVRILPPSHPFTQPANMGTFGIRQVVAAAADHVIVDRKHIDQVVIFFAVIAAIVLLAMQFLGILFLIFSGTAFAGGGTGETQFLGMFTTVEKKTDIAFMLLDHIFGIPEFFGSNVLGPKALPFHTALQTLFQFYNLALLLVAVLIFLYFVMVVVAETAIHGTPFGQRFNTVYAPLRLVFAIGLLVPLNYGFNGSQYIVLGAARAGSGMATNGWILFNKKLINPTGSKDSTLIAKPNPPLNVNIDQFVTIMSACKTAYKIIHEIEIKGYVTINNEMLEFDALDYDLAREKALGGNIPVVFGHYGGTKEHEAYAGKVIPYCGEITIPLTSRNPTALTQKQGASADQRIGPERIQEDYFELVRFLVVRPSTLALGERFAYALHPYYKEQNTCRNSDVLSDSQSCKTTYKPPSAFKREILSQTEGMVQSYVDYGVRSARDAATFKISQEVLKRGWPMAGAWYNQIAEVNGSIVDSVQGFPSITAWPMLMQKVQSKKEQQDGKMDSCDRFTANLADGQEMAYAGQHGDSYIAQSAISAYRYWYCDNTTEEKGLNANIFWDAMHVIFGSNGLFSLREKNADEIHPLAQLTAVGKSLVDSSIRNMAYSMGTAVGGGFFGAISVHWGTAAQAMSSFFVTISMIGLTAGFILFYILPFLPFIYFFFAVGAWVKTIFEAMVGAPLWALAHLRIDGDGFPGRSAVNGYFLIFEIFIRPILTVFGLLGGMAIFTALAVILNELFDFVVFQITGTELDSGTGTGGSIYAGEGEEFRRTIVDEFFFTILYAVILYMMGLASFKMIDLVPNNILRWMGAGVSTFADQAGDPKEGLVQWAAIGGYQVGGQMLGALNKAGSAVGSLGGALAAGAQPKQNQNQG